MQPQYKDLTQFCEALPIEICVTGTVTNKLVQTYNNTEIYIKSYINGSQYNLIGIYHTEKSVYSYTNKNVYNMSGLFTIWYVCAVLE